MTKISDDLMKKYELPTFDEWQNAIDAGAYDNFLELYQMFLKKTDHIPLKITEQLVEDLASATLTTFIGVFINFIKAVRTEYSEVLQYRKLAREDINKLEAQQQEVQI